MQASGPRAYSGELINPSSGWSSILVDPLTLRCFFFVFRFFRSFVAFGVGFLRLARAFCFFRSYLFGRPRPAEVVATVELLSPTSPVLFWAAVPMSGSTRHQGSLAGYPPCQIPARQNLGIGRRGVRFATITAATWVVFGRVHAILVCHRRAVERRGLSFAPCPVYRRVLDTFLKT